MYTFANINVIPSHTKTATLLLPPPPFSVRHLCIDSKLLLSSPLLTLFPPTQRDPYPPILFRYPQDGLERSTTCAHFILLARVLSGPRCPLLSYRHWYCRCRRPHESSECRRGPGRGVGWKETLCSCHQNCSLSFYALQLDLSCHLIK